MKATRSILLLATVLVIQSTQAQQWVRWKQSAGGNGHWYKAVVNTNGLNWTQANQIAINEGGYLATITSATENNFVFGLINSPDFFSGSGGNGSGPAIGGYQPDNAPDPATGWRWETGESWSYTNWAPGQPDSFAETRLEYWSGSQGVPAPTWNNLTSDDTNLGGYVIERDSRPTASPSGFYGQSFVGLAGNPASRFVGRPVVSCVSVYDSRGKLVTRVSSNPVGQFYSYVKPGDYTLVGSMAKQPLPPKNLSNTATNAAQRITVQITVSSNQLTPVELDF